MDTNKREAVLTQMDKFIGELAVLKTLVGSKPIAAVVRIAKLIPLAKQIVGQLSEIEDPDADEEIKARFHAVLDGIESLGD